MLRLLRLQSGRIKRHSSGRFSLVSACSGKNAGAEMSRQIAVVLYVVAMATIIVGADFAFFRNRPWERLAVNIGIVLVFAAFYWRFLRHP